ncbi:hypothetical protein PG989_007302 [Apiospora arundinis]
MASREDQPPQHGGLSTSPPHAISVHDPYPSEPLKVVAAVEQIASPFPERAVTILTKYSCLDTTPSEDAFFLRAMHSPQIAAAPDGAAPCCSAPELPLRPVARWITTTRVSGDPDLLKRGGEDTGFVFVTIPPVGQGHAEVAWELSPARLVRRLGNKDEPVQEKLLRLLRPGDTYKITTGKLSICWWAFGSLGNEGGVGDEEKKKKKVARWILPDDLPLVRAPGMDETEEVGHRLRDLVDLHDVNYLSSRSAVEGEQRPVVKKMRSEGWVFGEPEAGLTMVAKDQEPAAFTISE